MKTIKLAIVIVIMGAVVTVGVRRFLMNPSVPRGLPGNTAEGGAVPPRAANDLADSSAWLAQRLAAGKTIGDADDLVPDAAAVAAPGSPVIAASDVELAVRHISEGVYERFVQTEFGRYVAWRKQHGYRFLSHQDLAADPSERISLERVAGRGLNADEAPDGPFLAEVWRSVGLKSEPLRRASTLPEASLVLTGVLESGLAYGTNVADRRAFPDTIARYPGLIGPLGITLDQFRGEVTGLGWPQWRPPTDVMRRLLQRGTPFVEVALAV